LTNDLKAKLDKPSTDFSFFIFDDKAHYFITTDIKSEKIPQDFNYNYEKLLDFLKKLEEKLRGYNIWLVKYQKLYNKINKSIH
jgi:hypothetical protein